MLACHPRRQSNFDFYPSTDHLPSPSPSHSNLPFFNRLPATACTPSPSDFNGKPVAYFQQSPVTAHYESLDSENPQYLASASSVADQPEIRIEESTPTPLTTAGFPQHSTPVDNTAYSWVTLDGGDANSQMVATAGPNLQTAVLNRASRSHQRAASSSSIGSSGGSSPYLGHATSFSYSMAEQPSNLSKLSHAFNLESSRIFGNHLPTPTQTPTQDSFISHSYPTSNANFQHTQTLDSATAASMAMNRMMIDQEEDVPGMSHSGRHSLSSIGQEPSTPHTVGGDGYDVGLRGPSNGEIHFKVEDWIDNYLQYDDETDTLSHTSVPKLDIYADESFYPAVTTSMPVASSSGVRTHKGFISHPNQVREFLQAAQIARSQSPSTTISRDISPFRPDSPWATAVRLQSAQQSRESQKAQSYRNELDQHMSPQDNSAPKTISPKDAMLEYRPDEEESKMPLFSDAASYNQYTAQGNQQYNANTQSLGNMKANNAGNWRQAPTSNFATGQILPTSHQQSATFNFASPVTQPFAQGVVPFVPQNYGAASSMAAPKQDDTPDFPAHLTSMESSASEAALGSGSNSKLEAQRPEGSSPLAETGTYTCTYHGCSLRFETPQKLQRHKREGHRQVAAQQQHTPGVGSGMTSAALAARNSQSGPHKCERINPTTGKPCNVVFSRPYDLTRHEDTIHNARKQKVRCALCVEEKTFSRNDALTRHMRVVHPEVDFPGKHRRRGAHE